MVVPFRRLLRFAVLLVAGFAAFALLRFSGLLDEVDPEIRSARDRETCMERLARVGDRLRLRVAGGRLERASGAAFLLQVLPEIAVGEVAFRCPAAPEDGPACTWWGPDEATVAAYLDGRLSRDAILAACPRHAAGLVVLRADGSTEVPAWDTFLVRPDEEDALGPGSPDPRLRGLER